MPANFPEVWVKRVETNLSRADKAPWTDGIAELDVDVTVFASGEQSEMNTIHIPTTDFEPNVLVDNTTYPIALVSYTDDEVLVNLHKFQTEATGISDDATIGASYNKIDAATNSHTKAILKKKYSRAAHAMAPASNTAETPVLKTTGRTGRYKASDGSEIILKAGTRICLTYLDLVDFRAACVTAGMDFEGGDVRLVLCDDHYNDLLKDRDNFGDQLKNIGTGQVAPVILGFKIYTYAACPYYNGATKLAYGATPSAGQYQASFAFDETNVAKKTGKTRQYFTAAGTDTRTQSNSLNYRHYYIFMPKRVKYIAAITSDTAA